jgi:hypothetical protein
LEFLKTKVNSFVKWDLVRFFPTTPSPPTPSNIARYAGRDVTVKEDLALADDGDAAGHGGRDDVYSLVPTSRAR